MLFLFGGWTIILVNYHSILGKYPCIKFEGVNENTTILMHSISFLGQVPTQANNIIASYDTRETTVLLQSDIGVTLIMMQREGIF